MINLRVHYEVHEFGSAQARETWAMEGLIPDRVKFCDGLMMKKGRELDFTSKTDDVDCRKCQKKIDIWCRNGFDLPY